MHVSVTGSETCLLYMFSIHARISLYDVGYVNVYMFMWTFILSVCLCLHVCSCLYVCAHVCAFTSTCAFGCVGICLRNTFIYL